LAFQFAEGGGPKQIDCLSEEEGGEERDHHHQLKLSEEEGGGQRGHHHLRLNWVGRMRTWEMGGREKRRRRKQAR
jgi:hypothetical protein